MALTEIEAAIYIGMSRSFMRQDRSNGHRDNRTKGPVFMKIGRAVRYHLADLDEWPNNIRGKYLIYLMGRVGIEPTTR